MALVEGGRILLIRRAYAPYQHLWTLPGGRREPGESILDCAIREIGEELGLAVGGLVPVAVQQLRKDRQWQLAVFASADFAGTPTPSDEIADWAWLAPDEIGTRRTTAGLLPLLQAALGLVRQDLPNGPGGG